MYINFFIKNIPTTEINKDYYSKSTVDMFVK